MTTYDRGDVIFVEIAFSGAVGRKRRPAVVISSDAFNTAGIKLIVAAITSNVSPPFRPGDTLLKDWNAAGLLKPSAVRGVLATVDKADVVRKLGKLSTGDFTMVEQSIANVLGFLASTTASTP
ncbi:type II toxin-antitoxin system PemK/MazF family toxin [candidate division KSB1 bacterium]|nr:type II toxin-antitoxin system PemK/MazF family toxin [candidate division KSB1 bacterium]